MNLTSYEKILPDQCMNFMEQEQILKHNIFIGWCLRNELPTFDVFLTFKFWFLCMKDFLSLSWAVQKSGKCLCDRSVLKA